MHAGCSVGEITQEASQPDVLGKYKREPLYSAAMELLLADCVHEPVNQCELQVWNLFNLLYSF